MTAPDHLKITGPEDILGFIPHSLGYWPAHSLVAMTMQGKRLGATLRVDLPGSPSAAGPPPADAASAAGAAPPAGAADLSGFARSVASYLEADNKADGSLLALFTETDGDGAGWAPLLANLESALAEAGMPVRDAWLVGAEYWRNAYCLDPLCCALPGHPVEEIRNSRLNAEMVFRGSTVGAAPGSRLEPQPAPEPAVIKAQRDWTGQFSVRSGDRMQFRQVLDVWARVLQAPAPGPVLSPALTGYLRASLCVLPWRDAVLVMAAAGREAAERGAEDFGVFPGRSPGRGLGSGSRGSGSRGAAFTPGRADCQVAVLPPMEGFPHLPVRGRTGTGAGREGSGRGGDRTATRPEAAVVAGYGEVLLGLAPPVPDWNRLGCLERILVQLGGSGGEAGAAALTGRGWIEWCRGKGSFAHELFARANAEYPDYRLAQLLAELVSRGNLCGWARRREAAWQRFDPDIA